MDRLCYFCIVFVMLSRLLIAALWTPAGKGLTSWLSSVVLNCVVATFPFLYPESGVVLDCTDSWSSLPTFLLSFRTHSATYIRCSGPVTGSYIAYQMIIFRPSITSTMPLTTQIWRTATKRFATSQKINRNMQNILFIHLFVFFIM